MQNALGAAACILVEGYEYKDYTPNGVEGRGAYLHVTKYREGDGAATQSDMRDALFRAKYDCPLRIWPCDEGDDLNEQLPIVIGEIVSGSWNLEIEAGKLILFILSLVFMSLYEGYYFSEVEAVILACA